MEQQLEQTTQYIKRLNEYLPKIRRYVYSQIAYENKQDTGTLPLIDALIPIVEELEVFITRNPNSIDLTSLQTKLQGLTNQSVFELQQMEGVTESLNTLINLNSAQISPEVAVSSLRKIQDYVADSAISFVQNQKKIDMDISQDAKLLFTDTVNVLDYSLDKLAGYQPQNNETININDNTQDLRSSSESCISFVNTKMTSILSEVELKIKQMADCDFFDFEQLQIVGMGFLESVSSMKKEYAYCGSMLKDKIVEIFETTLQEKIKKGTAQIEKIKDLEVSHEFTSKISTTVSEQLNQSALTMKKVIISEIDGYVLHPKMLNEINNIIENQRLLTDMTSNSERYM